MLFINAGIEQVVHVVDGAMVPAFGEARSLEFVPARIHALWAARLGTICPTSRKPRVEALHDDTRGEFAAQQ